MAVNESGVVGSVAPIAQCQRNVIAEKIDASDLPRIPGALDREQALARGNQNSIVHHQPPDNAWKT
jgi:hypothetical protein